MFLFCFLPGNYFHFCQELFSGDLGQKEMERKRTRLVETCFNDCKFHIVKGGDIYRQSPIFLLLTKNLFQSIIAKMVYKPYTIVGPPVIRPIPDPLVVLSLNNQLYIPFCPSPYLTSRANCQCLSFTNIKTQSQNSYYLFSPILPR